MITAPIILATNNFNKLKEFACALDTEINLPKDFGIVEFNPIEDASTFSQNAMIKAKALLHALQSSSNAKAQNILQHCIILADDSGLCLEALNGEPGIFSARYANIQQSNATHENSSDKHNRQALMQKLKDSNLWGSKANFECCIAAIILKDNKELQHISCGKCEGIAIIKEMGEHGFGYDSMVYRDVEMGYINSRELDFSLHNQHLIERFQHSIATLPLEEKIKISHRGSAIRQLKEWLVGLNTSIAPT